MTIEQADKVDGMGIDTERNEVVLMISDHLEWSDQAQHFPQLEAKIGGYINFVQSGQLAEMMPKSRGLLVGIKLVYKYEPPDEVKRVLDSIVEQLSQMNLRFSYEILPSKY